MFIAPKEPGDASAVILPVGLSFIEAERMPLALQITLAIIFLLLAAGHAWRFWQHPARLHSLYIFACLLEMIGLLLVILQRVLTLTLRMIAVLFFVNGPGIMLLMWSGSMRGHLRGARTVHVISYLILVGQLLGAILQVGFEVPQATKLRAYFPFYVSGAWLMRASVVVMLLAVLLLLCYLCIFDRTRIAAAAGILSDYQRERFQQSLCMKRQQLVRLLLHTSLLLLAAILDAARVPFADFAVYALLAACALYPGHALHQYSTPPTTPTPALAPLRTDKPASRQQA